MTALHAKEHQQSRRLTKLGRKLSALKRRLLCPDYYDPFQREQQQQTEHHPWQVVTEKKHPIVVRQCCSLTSTVIGRALDGFHYGAAVAASAYELLINRRRSKARQQHKEKAMRGRGVDFSLMFERSTAWESRKQHVDKYIGQVCLKKQQEKKQQQKSSIAYASLLQDVHLQACDDDNEKWGFVYKGDCEAHFSVS
ncbi:hypothetical protein BX666DRAFT_2022728 [Dichotomocladium elegans]|nr:hypothetical protein BX666DRAFT_2022728 [Dichotomocladium elegans]